MSTETSKLIEAARPIEELIGQRMIDALSYGISIEKDGKRIAPEDFYLAPEPTATILIDQLERLTDLAARNAFSADDLALIAEMRREIAQVREMAGKSA